MLLSFYVDMGDMGVSAYIINEEDIEGDVHMMYHSWFIPIVSGSISPLEISEKYGNHYVDIDTMHRSHMIRACDSIRLHPDATQEEIENMVYMTLV